MICCNMEFAVSEDSHKAIITKINNFNRKIALVILLAQLRLSGEAFEFHYGVALYS